MTGMTAIDALNSSKSDSELFAPQQQLLMLHAGAVGDELLVWGELAPASGGGDFACAPLVALQRALAPLLAEHASPRKAKVVLWLPAADGSVRFSSPLLGGTRSPAAGDLAPRVAQALAFTADEFVAVLRALRGRAVLAPGVLVGDDVLFWWRTLRYAAALVAAQRYIPALESVGENGKSAGWRATWRPRIQVVQRRELAAIAQSMPGACRAITTDETAPPAKSPGAVVDRFVATVVDALVRPAAPPADSAAAATPSDRWLRALSASAAAPNKREVSSDGALDAFASQVAQWVRDTTREDGAEHRLCLRLEEPERDDDPWYVCYLLQAHADPSLLVSIDSAWKNPLLRRTFLETVGKAARLLPNIDASLREAEPAGFALDASGAHAFLLSEAPALEAEGLGVLLPAWWTPGGTRARLTATARVKRPRGVRAGIGLDSVVEVDWSVALGGAALSKRELEELARLKAPLVRLRGQWVLVDAHQIRAALDVRARRSTMRFGDVARMALTGHGPEIALSIGDVEATGAIRETLDRLSGRAAFEEQPVPEHFQGTLRPYQVRGYSWLRFLSGLGLGACLADDMGLGKSAMTLALISRDWQDGVRDPVLLVSPTSVIGNWQREIARFTPDLPVTVHHGGERTRDGLPVAEGSRTAIVLTSYGVLLRDLALLQKPRWRGIVLDEAQNIKNAESKQAQAARTLEGDYRVTLTGTPIENHVGDLWSLMEFLNPGILGTQASFRRDYLIPITAVGDAEAEARLKRTSGPFVLRRLKSDPAIIADLPKKFENSVFCQLTKEQASLYAAVLREVEQSLDEAEGISRRGLILATIAKLKQVCNHPVNLLRDNSPLAGRSGKLARLGEMLEEVHAAGDRALIFTQFTEMAALLRRYLQETTGREVLYLHGGVAKRERDRLVDRFQTADDAPGVFILSLRAGGTGLNLTRANHVFHYDRWWNPAVEDQASDRVYRIGQQRNVHVHRLVCAGTIEDKIDALLERKRGMAARLVRAGEAGLTDLSNAQLRELFELGSDAVADA